MRVESFSIKRGRLRKEINLILVSRSSRGFRTTPANWFVFFLSCASGGSRTGPSAYAQQLNASSSSSEIFVLDRTLISRSAELWRRLYPAFELPVSIRDSVSRQHGNSSRRCLLVFYLRSRLELPGSFREKFPRRTDGIGPRKSLFIHDIIKP